VGDNLEYSDFVKMSQDMANRYKTIISEDKLKAVKGGVLVFYEYEYEYRDRRWLAIAVLQRTEGINTSVDLDLVASQVIDSFTNPRSKKGVAKSLLDQ
jgi:nucleoid-associated protein